MRYSSHTVYIHPQKSISVSLSLSLSVFNTTTLNPNTHTHTHIYITIPNHHLGANNPLMSTREKSAVDTLNQSKLNRMYKLIILLHMNAYSYTVITQYTSSTKIHFRFSTHSTPTPQLFFPCLLTFHTHTQNISHNAKSSSGSKQSSREHKREISS